MTKVTILPYNQAKVTDFLKLSPKLIFHAIVYEGVNLINDSPNETPHDNAVVVRGLIRFLAETWNRGVIFSIIAVQSFNGAVLIMPTNTIFPNEPMLDEYINNYDIDYDLTFPALLIHKEEA